MADENTARPGAMPSLASPAEQRTVDAPTTRDGSWTSYGVPEPLPPRRPNIA